MYRETAQLLLYSNLPEDSVLAQIAGVYEDWTLHRAEKPALVHRIYAQVKRLLDIATRYGFDRNLWQDYLTLLLIREENSFSLTCEMTGATPGGSINRIAKADFAIFRRLFHFDFGPLERDLGIDCFTLLTHYTAIPKKEQMYNRAVSERVRALSEQIAAAKDADEIFDLVTDSFRRCGVGLFGMNRAFRVAQARDGQVDFLPISNIDSVRLDDLVGYERQKEQLRANVSAFVAGRGCNNMLLYGDAGTGKSTSVKALLTEYGDQGLRMIEIYKHQFPLLGEVIRQVKHRHYRFILFIDDLSFEENEVEYKFLKAVIEGGIETRPDNVLLCATSNRRHLIRETWADRSDMERQGDVHRSDTLEEKLSLAARFGCAISYTAPNRALWEEMVVKLAQKHPEIQLSRERLLLEANRWEIRHGGVSGRTAQQLMNYLSGLTPEEHHECEGKEASTPC